jgi:hypothetical protein
MAAIIVCDSCNRSWVVSASDSVYLELELVSRPCPFCEACTLSYREGADAHAAPRLHPAGRRRVAAAGPAGRRRRGG